jgi:hypothetical protein
VQQGHAGGADACAAGVDHSAGAVTGPDANSNSATHNLGGDAE